MSGVIFGVWSAFAFLVGIMLGEWGAGRRHAAERAELERLRQRDSGVDDFGPDGL